MMALNRTCTAACLMGLLAGCASEAPLVAQCKGQGARPLDAAPALVGVAYGTQATPIPLNSVQFSSWTVESSVSVQQLAATRTPTNTVSVTARFISCTDRDSAIRVRTSFFDAQHAPAEPSSAWQTVYLHPHLLATYSERSTSKGVTHYLIEVMSE
jgi:hypothetical protein